MTLESGKAAISVMLFPGEGADQELLDSLVGQVQGQWQNYREIQGYLIISQAAQGILKPDDPRMVQYFEMQVVTSYPFLKRVGQIEPIKVNSGSGILITWEGQNPMGMKVRASVYATILKEYGVALVGLGDSKRMETRKSTLGEIFSTFGLGEGEKDPRVFGSWRSENYSSSGITSDRINTTSIRNMILRPDGSCTSGGQFLASVENRSSSGTVDTGTGAGTHGRWGTGNNKLYLTWNDGSYGEYTYYVQGTPGSREMLLTPANGKKELWSEVR